MNFSTSAHSVIVEWF